MYEPELVDMSNASFNSLHAFFAIKFGHECILDTIQQSTFVFHQSEPGNPTIVNDASKAFCNGMMRVKLEALVDFSLVEWLLVFG
jgi:hypothetical protein